MLVFKYKRQILTFKPWNKHEWIEFKLSTNTMTPLLLAHGILLGTYHLYLMAMRNYLGTTMIETLAHLA